MEDRSEGRRNLMRVVARILPACILWAAAAPRVEAGMAITGTLYDGEASARPILDAIRQGQQFSPALKVPLAGQELTIELVDTADGGLGPGKAGRSWKTSTDGSGAFSVDTGLDRWPEKPLLVARVEREGRKLFSPYLKAAPGAQDVHVYPLTEGSGNISAEVKLAYDIPKSGETKSLRIRVGVRLMNRGGEMYVGRKSGSPWREIWRVPMPEGATIVSQSGPFPGVDGWRPAADGKALIFDTPVPGVCDFETLREFWVVELLVPPRQVFIQSCPVPLPVAAQSFTAWCDQGDMSLSSPQLTNKDSRVLPDPFSGEERNQEVVFSSEPLKMGIPVAVVLNIDNVAIGQPISLNAFKWVGGFVLACVLSLLLGLALGPKGTTAEALLESLSGEELLDRVADLDARFARGEIAERDYKRLREPLVSLAAEEVFGSQPAPAGNGATAAIPQGAREILRRIDEIEKSRKMDAALAAERAHLLEALARALPREASREA
jgi:hypothetical protein